MAQLSAPALRLASCVRPVPISLEGERAVSAHVHQLLARAFGGITRIVPDFKERMLAYGVEPVDCGMACRIYTSSRRKAPVLPLGIHTIVCSKSLIDRVLFESLSAHPRVEIRCGAKAASSNQTENEGNGSEAGPFSALKNFAVEGHLVVDATGLRRWGRQLIRGAGFGEPTTSNVDVRGSFASRGYRLKPGYYPDWRLLYLYCQPPEHRRFCTITICEEWLRKHYMKRFIRRVFEDQDPQAFKAFMRVMHAIDPPSGYYQAGGVFSVMRGEAARLSMHSGSRSESR